MALIEDRRKVTIRLAILQYVVVVTFSVLAVSFWVLQVVQHAKYEEMAENNHQRTLMLRAPRGLVFDRNGHVLVENRHSYNISIDRERTKGLNRTIQLLASVVGTDEAVVRDIVNRHKREPIYRPITIVQDATLAQVAAVTARRLDFELPGVVLEPANGEVLAYTSVPAYDPNAFASGVDRATWASLTNDEQRPLNDRAIQGRYSPGSTFKMAVAIAALEEGVITPDTHVYCPGHGTFYGRSFACHKKEGHGTLDLRHAIEQSCDVYFYTVGLMLNERFPGAGNTLSIDKINKWAAALGLGVKSGIDLPNEVQGLVPSTEWKREKIGRAHV